MTMSDLEDWGLPLAFIFAVAFCATMNQAPISPANALERTAEARMPPDLTMTITAKRLPAECKGANAASNEAMCAAYFDEAPVVALRAVSPQFAGR